MTAVVLGTVAQIFPTAQVYSILHYCICTNQDFDVYSKVFLVSLCVNPELCAYLISYHTHTLTIISAVECMELDNHQNIKVHFPLPISRRQCTLVALVMSLWVYNLSKHCQTDGRLPTQL